MVLQPSDTTDRWRVRFDPTGFWWDRGREPADATVSGTTADLYLFLQGRQRPSITITGQSEIVERWTAALDFLSSAESRTDAGLPSCGVGRRRADDLS